VGLMHLRTPEDYQRYMELGYRKCYWCMGTQLLGRINYTPVRLDGDPRNSTERYPCDQCSLWGGLVPYELWREQVIDKENNPLRAIEIIEDEREWRETFDKQTNS